MALIFDHNPSDVTGHNLATETGQLQVIRAQEGGTWNNFSPAPVEDDNALFPGIQRGGNGQYRIAIAGPNGGAPLLEVTPNEGTHLYMLQQNASWGANYTWLRGGKVQDRVDLQMGNLDIFGHGDERWYGVALYFDADTMLPNDGGWHTNFECHTSGAIASSIASLFTIGLRANGRMWIYLRNGGQPSTVEGRVTVYDQTPKWVINEWLEFKVHVIASTTQNGTFEVWFRRPSVTLTWEKIVNIVGNAWAGFTDGIGANFRMQVGSYLGPDSTDWTRRLFVGRLRIGDETSNGDEIEPRQTGGSPPPVKIAPVSFTPQPGTYVGTQSVLLSSPDSGVKLRYTVDGATTPTPTVGTEINDDTSINITTTTPGAGLQVIAYPDPDDGRLPSDVSAGVYTINTPAQVTVPHRINCGGAGFTDQDANTWVADQYNVAGGVTGGTPPTPTGSTPENRLMYQFGRWWTSSGSYSVPIANGVYRVRLHHDETWPPTQAIGARVINVTINGVLLRTGLDVFKEVGGDTVLVTDYPLVFVQGGTLDILLEATANNPEVKGIEILPPVLPAVRPVFML